MPTFKEYLPAFFSGFDKISFTFDTFDELKEKLKEKLDFPQDGYEMCCGDYRTLMGISSENNPRYTFFVRGFVEDFDLTDYLKKYDDKHYTENRFPTVKEESDEEIRKIVDIGKLLSDGKIEENSRWKTDPPNIVSFGFIGEWEEGKIGKFPAKPCFRVTGNNILWESFSCEFQHFRYIGDRSDIYYFVGLVSKAKEEILKHRNSWEYGYRNDDPLSIVKDYGFPYETYEETYEKIVGKDKLDEIDKKAEDCVSQLKSNLILQLEKKMPGKSFSCDIDNSYGYVYESVYYTLLFQEIVGVHKELPKVLTERLDDFDITFYKSGGVL